MKSASESREAEDWEAQRWELGSFHPACGSPLELAHFFDSAAAALEQACGQAGPALFGSYREALKEVTGLLALDDVQREVSAPEQAQSWARITEPAALRARAAQAALLAALTEAAPGLISAARGCDAAFLRQLAERAAHAPPKAGAAWAALARRGGLELPRELHARQLKSLLVAELHVGQTSVTLRPSNLRALLASEDRELRRCAWDFRKQAAARAADVLQGINAQRALYRTEEARLSGYSDVLESACADFRISRATHDAVCAQAENARRFADGFFQRKQQRLGLDRLEEFDLGAPSPCPSAAWLRLEHLVDLLERPAGRLHSAFPAVLREVKQRRALLTDSRATFSASWFTLPHYGGGTPLVHIPYHRSVDDFCAAAHELGHACHTAVVARELGPVAAADEALCYSEVFSLAFEIAAVNQAFEQAASRAERDFWRSVVLEQAAHFLRTLPIRSRFDQLTYLERIPPAQAWAEAHRELSPSWLPLPSPDDASWALSTSSEDAPFQGRAYCLAFLLAYLGYLSPERHIVQRLLSDGPWLPLEVACWNAARLELTHTATFAPVWEHLNRVMNHD